MKRFKQMALVLTSSFLFSCSTFDTNDEYSCPGIERGAQCMSIIEAKELTDDPNWREKLDHKKHHAKTVKIPMTPLGMGPAAAPISQPKPILQPAQVLRIWIAPFNDSSTDLHWTSYVFTEITPRRFSIGEESIKNTKVLTPIKVDKPVEEKN